jgi:hypothetical protein
MGVRGYADWSPKPEAAHWVNRVVDVCEEYRDYWPLSVRQLFYRLVADHSYEKTEAAYSKLTGLVSRARRAGYLPWDAIRDGGLGRTVDARYFEGADHFQRSVRRWASDMQLDRQRGQDKVIELWCEAGGMVPILEGIGQPFSCRVNTGGGYDSVTAKHRLAERVRERAEKGLKTVVLHVGDFDGSGEDMANVLRDDALHMVATQVVRRALEQTEGLGRGNWPEWIPTDLDFTDDNGVEIARWACSFFDVQRVALTGEQVVERRVETAPPKRTDSRTAEFVRRNRWVAEELDTTQITAQLEALTPPELDELLTEAIREHIDDDAFEAVVAEEDEVREELLRRLGT